jgi:hypothetical protein
LTFEQLPQWQGRFLKCRAKHDKSRYFILSSPKIYISWFIFWQVFTETAKLTVQAAKNTFDFAKIALDFWGMP